MTITLEQSTREKVEKWARDHQQTPDEVIARAIDDYLEHQTERENLHHSITQAIDDYRRTNLHLTHEEIEDWFSKLEAGEDAELPPCHP